MPSSDVLELNDVLFVPSLTKNLFLHDNLHYLVKLGHHRDRTHVAKGVQVGDLYRLQENTMKHSVLVHSSDELCEPCKSVLVTYTMEHFPS
jgi:hypothetical protein